ncbi:hypothetical protein I5677_14830 [Mobilitalea sibirica]|uniref:Uncharacterized protein n=1 Tax=Mobilitalea sibirica TaxID=1462919 RepID=A0A8J7HDK4_9FIRM|nr:hypothetical protein [Mobilitalea sibirica]MBH1942172.1 hypothetical protein [Mobilitalea sibirica]
MNMHSSPDVVYSGYNLAPMKSERCCQNCKHYAPTDDLKGKCYEYEVLPYAGCNFFEKKEN